VAVMVAAVPPTAMAQVSGPRFSEAPGPGVVIMAHGGDSLWNKSVNSAVESLGARMPAFVAFGMAEPEALRVAFDSVTRGDVTRVALVRLFMSGRSFRAQTEYLVGLSEERPRWFMTHGEVDPASVQPIAHTATVATHDYGLMGSTQAAQIVIERARQASVEPMQESVLLLAHGMREEAENDEIEAAMERIAETLRAAGFSTVSTETLREDWPEKRRLAEARIRGFVQGESERDRRVIVVPFRLSGFGPFAAVLEGLDYVPTKGLLPHEAVSDWIVSTARSIICQNGWAPTSGECAAIQQE
jgi:hypothetical protein